MPLIQFKTGEEGEFFCKWLENRLIRNNKNVLSAELGPTGSGKSYRDLRKAELWYKYYFKEDFPTENICFGLGKVMDLLSSGKLRRGEVIVVEEAGVNLGSREWQSKVSRIFNHILQSFRSMNLALFMNLPYLSMLDTQARHLLHYYAESAGIDQEKKINKCKPFFLQVAQSTGKIYRHYPKIDYKGRKVKLKRFAWKMPSKYLIDSYEEKKRKYLAELTTAYADKMNGKQPADYSPQPHEIQAFDLWKDGKKQWEIAEEIKKSQQQVSVYIRNVKRYKEKGKNVIKMPQQ